MKEEKGLHSGHWKRLRDKAFSSDIANFSDREVLELTLQYFYSRGDLNDISARLLRRFGTFYKVFNATKDELIKVEGVGEAVAEKIVLFSKIVNFYGVSKMNTKTNYVYCVADCVNIAKGYLDNLEHERLYMFCMNGTGKIVDAIILGEGKESSVKLKTKDVALKALKTDCTTVFFAHNHPNGTPMPSMQDINFTKQVLQSLYFFGIKVVDHIIVCGDKHFSFRNEGMIDVFSENMKKIEKI